MVVKSGSDTRRGYASLWWARDWGNGEWWWQALFYFRVLSLCVDKKRTVLRPNTVCRETATGGLMDCSIICLCLEINKGPSNHWTPTLGFNAMFQWLSLDSRRLSLLRSESHFHNRSKRNGNGTPSDTLRRIFIDLAASSLQHTQLMHDCPVLVDAMTTLLLLLYSIQSFCSDKIITPRILNSLSWKYRCDVSWNWFSNCTSSSRLFSQEGTLRFFAVLPSKLSIDLIADK